MVILVDKGAWPVEGAIHQVPSFFLGSGNLTAQSQTLSIQDPGLFTWGAGKSTNTQNRHDADALRPAAIPPTVWVYTSASMHCQPIRKSWIRVIWGIEVLRNSKCSVDSLVLSTGTTEKSSSSAPGSPPAPRACFILVISLNKSAECSLLTNRLSVSQDSWKIFEGTLFSAYPHGQRNVLFSYFSSSLLSSESLSVCSAGPCGPSTFSASADKPFTPASNSSASCCCGFLFWPFSGRDLGLLEYQRFKS